MIPLYTQEQFNLAKTSDILLCQCYHCKTPFEITKRKIKTVLNPNNKTLGYYCSKDCSNKNRKPKILVKCINCNSDFEKLPNQVKKSPNHFCSKSCAVTYNNKNKTYGTRRSKLEIYLEEQLITLYPELQIDFNKKSTIGSELDIYIPSLNLAFELNGIFHYEPIYGANKLDQIKSNDISKSKACHEHKIDLCIIDTSGQNYFKVSTSQKYLEIIINIINERYLHSA